MNKRVKKYSKYLAIVLIVFFALLISYPSIDNRDEILLSPGEEAPSLSPVSVYLGISPLLSGMLIVAAAGLLALIVVESKYS